MTTWRALHPFASLRRAGCTAALALLRAWARSAIDVFTLAYAVFYWAWVWVYERDTVRYAQAQAAPARAAPPQWSPLNRKWSVEDIWGKPQ